MTMLFLAVLSLLIGIGLAIAETAIQHAQKRRTR